jgi:phage terminase small subunit
MTPKQEKFCQLYVETGNASAAYRGAYDATGMLPATVNKRASELLADGDITGSIDALRALHAEQHGMTVANIAAMLLEDRIFAKDQESPAAAVSATMGLAKLYGHLRDKVEHTSPDGSMTPREPRYVLVKVDAGKVTANG